MKDLPTNLVAYKKTPVFKADTIPAGLLKSHTTKNGTWGKICVLNGQLEYCIEIEPEETIVLDKEKSGVVEPEVPHHVKPLGDVEFFVEFYKSPS